MAPDRGLDRLLDRSVIGGYTSLGLALRRRCSLPPDPPAGVLDGRRALVTGAAGGIGEATAEGLARLGAAVHLLGRSPQRLQPAIDRITARLDKEGLTAKLEAEVCDVSSLGAVRAFAADFASRLSADDSALDVLVHNAGVLPAQRTESEEGHELTLATHVLGPVLMTELLRPVLAASDHQPRVIFVASGGMYLQSLNLDNLEYREGKYRGAAVYARTKRMQVELADRLNARLAGDGIRVDAMHPGWVDTAGVAEALPGFRKLTRPLLRSAEDGADTIVWLAASQPPPEGGGFWHDRVRRPTSYRASTRPTDDEVSRLERWVYEQFVASDRSNSRAGGVGDST